MWYQGKRLKLLFVAEKITQVRPCAEVLAAFRALTRGTANSGGGGASVLVVADACLPSVASGEAPLGQVLTGSNFPSWHLISSMSLSPLELSH